MRGGYRPNAGRKKGYSAIETEKARELIVRMVTEALEPILNSLLKQAKRGNTTAIKELLDRAYGRSSQGIDITSAGKALPIPIMSLGDDEVISRER